VGGKEAERERGGGETERFEQSRERTLKSEKKGTSVHERQQNMYKGRIEKKKPGGQSAVEKNTK